MDVRGMDDGDDLAARFSGLDVHHDRSRPTRKTKAIRLMDTQVPHVARMKHILTSTKFAIDLSAMGTGKTFCTTRLQLDLGLPHCVVVCPKSVKIKWRQMAGEYGLPIQTRPNDHLLTYSSLRSTGGRAFKHELLSRSAAAAAAATEPGGGELEPTKQWLRMVDRGVLVVVDEFQHVKNDTAQTRALAALLLPILRASAPACPSRVVLLSASPFDKEEQVVTMFRLLGLIDGSSQLSRFDMHNGRNVWGRGMRQIVDFCAGLNAPATQQLAERFRHAKTSELRTAVYRLFLEVVKPAVASTMAPPRIEHELSELNAFYHVEDAKERAALQKAVRRLAKACSYDEATGTVRQATSDAAYDATGSLSATTSALMDIERAKLGTFARVAAAALDGEPKTKKVVICVNYTESIQRLRAALARYEPLVLTGKTSDAQRTACLKRFQQPDTSRRLLICNLLVCSTGIDLDDKHGGFPRFALINANYSAITLYQLGHRFMRADTQSSAVVHFVFGEEARTRELPILDALARKSAVMKAVAEQQSQALFPGNLPSWYEREEAREEADDGVAVTDQDSDDEDGGIEILEVDDKDDIDTAAMDRDDENEDDGVEILEVDDDDAEDSDNASDDDAAEGDENYLEIIEIEDELPDAADSEDDCHEDDCHEDVVFFS